MTSNRHLGTLNLPNTSGTDVATAVSVNRPNLGPNGASGGAAAPRPNKPQTLQAASYHLSMVGCMGLAVKLMLRMAVWSI